MAIPVYLCTDINQRASVCTFTTGKQNKVLSFHQSSGNLTQAKTVEVPLDPITCDLSRPLSMRLRHCIDIILFNPPYVPTVHEESVRAQGNADIVGSWAGGLDGMEVTNRFLDDAGVCPHSARMLQITFNRGQDLLSDCGKFYLVALAQNNIPEIRQRMREKFNMNSQVCVVF